MKKAFFFDMDGVLLDSLPNHVKAWEETFAHYGIHFTPEDCYLNEGRTSRDTIRVLADRQGVAIPDDRLEDIYKEKTAAYRRFGGGGPMRGVAEVLTYISSYTFPDDTHPQIWVVTGGAQPDLYEQLEGFFPGIFRRNQMITGHDVTHGKPNPEPYLKAFAKAQEVYLAETGGCLTKDDCVVIENAPLGTRSGRAAELDVYAVQTGPLPQEVFEAEDATRIFADMHELLTYIQVQP